ncbi:ADP-ribosylglycohydrolase family protein [Planctomycetota bacterium]
MLGAIAGDIIGSVYEHHNVRSTDFPLFSPDSTFTDDTVLTCAVAEMILYGGDYAEKYRTFYGHYPDRGYGGSFRLWARGRRDEPYNSFGNGSAMRVSPIGYMYDDRAMVLDEAMQSAEVTHNHPEGIKGAQAVAAAVFMAREGRTKSEIRDYVMQRFGYDLSGSVQDLREHYTYDVTCQGTVPQAMMVFLASKDYEDAIRKAISIGGDSDTIACITGGIAEAHYGGVPDEIAREALDRLDDRLRCVVLEFREAYHL